MFNILTKPPLRAPLEKRRPNGFRFQTVLGHWEQEVRTQKISRQRSRHSENLKLQGDTRSTSALACYFLWGRKRKNQTEKKTPDSNSQFWNKRPFRLWLSRWDTRDNSRKGGTPKPTSGEQLRPPLGSREASHRRQDRRLHIQSSPEFLTLKRWFQSSHDRQLQELETGGFLYYYCGEKLPSKLLITAQVLPCFLLAVSSIQLKSKGSRERTLVTWGWCVLPDGNFCASGKSQGAVSTNLNMPFLPRNATRLTNALGINIVTLSSAVQAPPTVFYSLMKTPTQIFLSFLTS